MTVSLVLLVFCQKSKQKVWMHSQRISEVISVHPDGSMNMSTRFVTLNTEEMSTHGGARGQLEDRQSHPVYALIP